LVGPRAGLVVVTKRKLCSIHCYLLAKVPVLLQFM